MRGSRFRAVRALSPNIEKWIVKIARSAAAAAEAAAAVAAAAAAEAAAEWPRRLRRRGGPRPVRLRKSSECDHEKRVSAFTANEETALRVVRTLVVGKRR
jgi:plasmid stabilization system protein ParE